MASLNVQNLALQEDDEATYFTFFPNDVVAGATEYGIYDSGADGGYFSLNGTKLADGQWNYLNQSQLAGLVYVAGAGVGSETVSFGVYSYSTGWVLGSATAAVSAPVATPPVSPFTAANVTLEANESIAASSLMTSNGGATPTEYSFSDQGGDGGYLVLNGVALTSGQAYVVTAAELSQLSYVAGNGVGVDSLSIESYNGATWSAAVTASVNVVAGPSLVAEDKSISAERTIFASSLIASKSLPSGQSATEYAFMNSGADGGQLFLNGVALQAGQWTTIAAADLCHLTYTGGLADGSDAVSIKVFDGVSWSTVAISTVTQTVTNVLSEINNTAIAADVGRLMSGGSLSYDSMLTILQEAAKGGMTVNKLDALQTLAGLLNAPGGVSTSAYVQDITQNVVDGNGANAYWTGGSTTQVALGNLTSTSLSAQFNELIGKWFLGTDLPNVDISSVGETSYGAAYQTVVNPLFGSSGTPSYLDVNQGAVGDCYFVASLGEVALQDPSAIESMISANGNGTYSVRFLIDGQAEYVTVNNSLAVMSSGQWSNGQTLAFANGNIAWPELIEKAYAQLNSDPVASAFSQRPGTTNAYANIDGGLAVPLTEITGQAVNTMSLSSTDTSSQIGADAAQLAAAFGSGQSVLLDSSVNDGSFFTGHMYELVGFNAATDVATIHNPWGSAGTSSGYQMTFTETMSQLAVDGAGLYVTTGHPLV